MIGKLCGSLTVLQHVYDDQNRHSYKCACACGNRVVYTASSLLKGKARTCQHCARNAFEIRDGSGVGFTANGSMFLFDLEVWDDVTSRNWHRTTKGYIVSGKGADRRVLHRLVVCAPAGMQVDHINRNKADCRQANLRLAFNAMNAANACAYRNNFSTGHKNVYAVNDRFRVIIRKNARANNFGYYNTLYEAVSVANEKRRELFGEFAFFDEMTRRSQSRTSDL